LFAVWQASWQRRVVPSPAASVTEVKVLPRRWRLVVVTLRVCAGLGLAWIGLDMLRRTGLQVQSLSQLKLFAGAVVVPTLLAWGVERLFSTTRKVAGADARTDTSWLDHAAVKFMLFPLLPAAVAFRLHQMIAFGSPLGEYYTYGLGAWLSAALIWWTSWALGMVLFASVLRIVVEAVSLIARWLAPARALAWRDAMQWISRALYYLGVPIWLALRLLSN